MAIEKIQVEKVSKVQLAICPISAFVVIGLQIHLDSCPLVPILMNVMVM